MNSAAKLIHRSIHGAAGFSRRSTLVSPKGMAVPFSRIGGSAHRLPGRHQFSTIAATKPAASNNNNNLVLGLLGGFAIAGLHSATGSQNDFFDYRFKTSKPTVELASFYGGEELMELFCIFPFVGQLMMRNGTFDEDGNVITTGIPGTL